MADNVLRYCFGRLNLIASYTDKLTFIWDGLNSGKKIGDRIMWGFFNVSKIHSNKDETFIHGQLVKYKRESDQEVAVPEKHKLDSVTIPNTVIAKSKFFMQINSGVIAFHPVAQKIEYNHFCEKFVELFEQAYDNILVNAEIQGIQERFKLIELIKEFTALKKITVKLHPSNPDSSPIWRFLDEKYKKLNIKSYSECYESDEKGLEKSIADDDNVKAKIVMAEDGYGMATISGTLNDENVKISSSDNPKTADIVDSEDPQVIIEQLKPTIDEIKQRFVRWD